MVSTRNFNPISDPKLLCTCGDSDCDRRTVKQSVLDMVQLVRDDIQRPLKITSGGRCPKHPNEIHRTRPADHQKCQAVDIFVKSALDRGELVQFGIRHGFNAIGVAKTFVHLGHRPELESGKIIIWTY